jgi:hypothetical protein
MSSDEVFTSCCISVRTERFKRAIKRAQKALERAAKKAAKKRRKKKHD